MLRAWVTRAGAGRRVLLESSAFRTIRGTTSGAGNVISGNDWEGVHIVASSDNVVEGDNIDLSVGGNE